MEQFKKKEKAEKNIDVTIKLELPNQKPSEPIVKKTRLASGDSPDVFFALHAINDIPLFDKAGYLEDLSNEPFVDKNIRYY
ncbi:hypothetical protein GCM10020331_087030 [Ectobacillus funiculus]